MAALRDAMCYSPLTVHDPAQNLSLKFYEAHPCVGKKILTADGISTKGPVGAIGGVNNSLGGTFNFEPEGSRALSLVLTGNTWNFWERKEKS